MISERRRRRSATGPLVTAASAPPHATQRAAALDAVAGHACCALRPRPGVALVAVGGLGRRECAPHSDLDLVLLHDGVARVDDLAAAIWYPIWDARLGLDHSVRTLGRGAVASPATT